MDLIQQIKACNTMPELDDLRLDIVQNTKDNPELFKKVQREFIKKKNQLNRIPLFERNW